MSEADEFWTQERIEPEPIQRDATSVAPLDLRIGEGEMPVEFDVFSWPAFGFAGLWAIAYGVWPVLLVNLGAFTFTLTLGTLRARGLPLIATAPLHAIYLVSLTVFLLWLGVNGHRLAWRAAQRRAVKGKPLPKQTVGQVMGARRRWMLIVAGLQVLSAITVVQGMLTPSPYSQPLVLSVMSIVYLAVYFLAALDLDFHGLLWRILFARKRVA